MSYAALYILVGLAIILESFPISSSGHILLLQNIFQNHLPFLFNESIDYFLHAPTAVVIALFFYKKWRILLTKRGIRFWPKIFLLGAITDGITVISYFLFFKNAHSPIIPIWSGFCITGIILLSMYFCNTQGKTVWNATNAVILGIAQTCALIPGISRFGTTFAVARWLGFSSQRAFSLSFLIEWPISFAASLKGTYILTQTKQIYEFLHPSMLLVIILAMIGAYIGLYCMQKFIIKQYEWIIGFYLFLVATFAFFQ